jgi:hypothetical protein
MLQTLTDTAAIRTEAAQSAEGIDGAVTDRQLDRSREAAYLFMIETVTETIYEAVRTYAGADPELVKKRDRFKRAECCFALHTLPSILSNQRLTKDGIKKTVEMSNGKYRTDYASQEESKSFGQNWLGLAYRWLSPYLSNEILDENNDQVGVRSNDGGFVMMSI